MDLGLRGVSALVTGSSGGIGEGIAKTLSSEGAAVVVHGRNEARTERVAAEIEEAGGEVFVAVGDLSTDDGAERVARKALSFTGGVDILVNNAGAYENRGWPDAAPDGWAELYNQNVLSAVRLIHLLTPGMKEKGWGRVIQLASGEASTLPLHARLRGDEGRRRQPHGQPLQGTRRNGRHGEHGQPRHRGYAGS